MSLRPLVSIVIPNFNRVSLIGETILSLQAQTYDHWEALIVDDGSTDGSQDLIKRIAAGDNRLKFLERKSEPKGAPVCRNMGMKAAKGDYLIFLDSDDLLAPFCLANRVGYMEANSALDFAVFMNRQFHQRTDDHDYLVNVPTEVPDLKRFLTYDTPWVINNPIWRMASISSYSWDEQLLRQQDYVFNILPLIDGLQYKWVITEPDCFWRRGVHESISKKQNTIELLDTEWKVTNRVYEALKKNNLLDRHIDPIVASYIDIVLRTVNTAQKKAAGGLLQELINKKLISNIERKYVKYICALYAYSKHPKYQAAVKRLLSALIGKDRTYKNHGTFGRIKYSEFYLGRQEVKENLVRDN